MEIRLDGRVALVTGGSRGLGFAMGKAFADAGADVVLIARRAAELAAARDTIVASSARRVLAIPCDVADAAQIASAWRQVEVAFGKVDILVNNAGSSRRGTIETLSDADWQADFDLKVFAALRLARLAIPGMKARSWGRILNLVNTLAKTPTAGSAPTSVSRAAGIAITKVMANELAPHNILVNALCIGNIMSDQWPRFHAQDGGGATFEAFLATRAQSIPMQRLGEPGELASLACLLVSDAGGYVTGTAINVDGGLCPAV
jgi:NAD(P)-dependent dehydrogenase (short-subunit alcohol dehydrogenase family)